jgi:DNA polymerase-3 subunit epsilon
MRQIVLDTETTGLEVGKGHRIIEIGCIELSARRPSGRRFHYYLDPERPIDEGAFAVHGISSDFLRGKPRFADIAQAFLDFVGDAEIVAHNADFDIGFLEAELEAAGMPAGCLRERSRILDTLALAREKYPGQHNNLNALCRRLGVDVSQRDLHGALLDAQLLAEAYLAMTAGQGDLVLGSEAVSLPALDVRARLPRRVRVIAADAAELAAHAQRLARVDAASDGRCIWLRDVHPLAPAREPAPSAAAGA